MSHLMRPLGSADLKPRGYQQAAAAPVIPEEAVEEAAAAVQQPMPTFEPIADGAAKEEVMASPAETTDAEPELEEILQSLLGEEAKDDDAETEGPDAIPSEQMPEPVFVPLYADDIPKRKNLWWLWMLLMMLAAGAGYVMWRMGLIEKFGRFAIDKWNALRYNLSNVFHS